MVQSLIGVKQIRGIFRTGCQVEWQRTPYVDYQYSLMVFFHENKFLFLIPIYNNLYNDVMKKKFFPFYFDHKLYFKPCDNIDARVNEYHLLPMLLEL